MMFGDDLLNKDPAKRAVIYVMGLFIMTLGVSISVKSNLGVSPVSSIHILCGLHDIYWHPGKRRRRNHNRRSACGT